MTESEYFYAWVAYLAAAVVFWGLFWYLTRKIAWAPLRNFLRMVLGVVLLVPWTTDKTHDVLSPAWIVSAGDALIHGPTEFWRAGLALVLALLVGTVGLILFYAIAYWRARGRAVEEPAH